MSRARRSENVVIIAKKSVISYTINLAPVFSPPVELPDVSSYPLLLAELTRDRRWSASDIKKLVGGNLLRVLKEVENHAVTVSLHSPAEELISQQLIEDTAYCRYEDE